MTTANEGGTGTLQDPLGAGLHPPSLGVLYFGGFSLSILPAALQAGYHLLFLEWLEIAFDFSIHFPKAQGIPITSLRKLPIFFTHTRIPSTNPKVV